MSAPVINDFIPDVDFVVVRFDYLTDSIKGICEFSQPYRKRLPDEEYKSSGNIFYKILPAADFGSTEIRSRLTGERIFYATTVWNGTGVLHFPADSAFHNSYAHGFPGPAPDSLQFIRFFSGTRAKAESIWKSVKDLDVIHQVTQNGNYGVLVFDHFYTVGAANPYTAEWYLIAYSTPHAPIDISIEKTLWPKKLVTRNINSNAEVRPHNFSDDPVEATLHFAATDSKGYTFIQASKQVTMPADSSLLVSFPYTMNLNDDSVHFQFNYSNPDNTVWTDAYSDNDSIDTYLGVTTQPLFRPVSSIKHPGWMPTNGDLLDFNGDGRWDVFQHGFSPKLLMGDSSDNFVDVTGHVSVALPHHPRLALAEDFNGDAVRDIVIISFGNPPMLLLGNVAGDFIDFTAGSGLDKFTGYWSAAVVDIDNDGDKDLILQSYAQEPVLLNDGAGHFTSAASSAGLLDDAQTESITVADINNDNFPEVLLTNWSSSPKLFKNDGNGTFSYVAGPWNFMYGRMSAVADMNGDGLRDIVFARGHEDDETLLFKSKGGVAFDPADTPGAKMEKAFHCDAKDINGDGKTDLILDHLDSFSLLLNEGDQCSDHSELLVDMNDEILSGALGSSAVPVFADLNNDGFIDIYSRQVVFINQGFDPELTVQVQKQGTPAHSFSLNQNYPNPFNSTTTITYLLPAAGVATLTLFDILGREVKNVVNEWKEAGTHTVTFTATGLSSSVYFYRLQAGAHTSTRKMAVVK